MSIHRARLRVRVRGFGIGLITSHLERRRQRVSRQRDAARDARRQRRRVRRNRRGRRGRRRPGLRHTRRWRHRSRCRRLVFLRRRLVLLVGAATVLIEEPGDGWTAASAQHWLGRWPWPEAGEGKRCGEHCERHQGCHSEITPPRRRDLPKTALFAVDHRRQVRCMPCMQKHMNLPPPQSVSLFYVPNETHFGGWRLRSRQQWRTAVTDSLRLRRTDAKSCGVPRRHRPRR